MRIPTLAASAIVVASFTLGCDNNSEPTPVAPSAGAVNDNARDAAGDLNRSAAEAQDRTATAVNEAGAEMGAATRNATAAAGNAATGVTAEAQTLFDQARTAMNSAKFDEAEKYVEQLKGMRSRLPAEWQTRVDDLAKMVTDAKAKLGNVQMPTMPR